MAVRRARHQIWDNPRVFEDPVALKIVGPDAVASLKGSRPAGPEMGRYLRAFVVARSRYAEDQLAEAVERGVKQYVVLGAGLDTFAYRNPYGGLKVFEVDHPSTQAWKRERLRASGIPIPASLTFVPVDFQAQSLADELDASGFSAHQPAFFSWLGVTPYLAPENVLGTLRWVISVCSQNGVAFDYAVPRSLLSPIGRLAFDYLANRVATAGEPFQGFFEPGELRANLERMGYSRIEDLGAEEINARYFKDRSDGLCVAGGGRLMHARGLRETNSPQI